MVEKFKICYNIQQIVIIADAGLLLLQNIQALCELNYQFIPGARIKNESRSLQQQILSQPWSNGQVLNINKEEVVRLIVSYSETRAHNDNKNRERGL